MGLTYIAGEVKGPKGKASAMFFVDGGAGYSLLPYEVWTKIGLKPHRELEFILADGTIIKRNISECFFSFKEGQGHTPVILGQKNDKALLGAITLEIMGLILNPFNRTLQPMKMMLA